MGTTQSTPAPVPAPPAKPSIWLTIAKSAGAIAAGGAAVFLTAMQSGSNSKIAGYSAGAAALTTLLGYLTKSPNQQ